MDQNHVVLYRRFRPVTFDEIVEQKAPVTALKQAVISKKIGHAYLFCGQRGTGKTTIAKVFSRAINCENPINGNPCNQCATCKGIIDGSLLDVIEMDAASNSGVDSIRKICDEANFAPSKAPHKVYIIDEVHMLSDGAFNALLKTLEEPPSHVVFLFATTESHKIPATILSRCQRYDFKRIPLDSIVSRLRYICDQEKIDMDTDALRLIASLSDGALRDSISLLEQTAGSVTGRTITEQDVENIAGTVDTTFLFRMANALIDGQIKELFELSAKLTESGRDRIRFTLDLAQYFRELLVIRTVPDPKALLNYSNETIKAMYQTANKVSADTIIGYISYLSKMVSDLKWSPSIQTSFETGLIRLCGRKSKLEPTPLVMPEFAAKQAEAAKVAFATSSAPAPEVKEPVKEEPKTEVKEEVKVEVKKEEKPEEPKPEVKLESPFDRFAALKESLRAKTSEPAPKEEPVAVTPTITIPEPELPVVEQVIEPAPVVIPEEAPDPEDVPMDNQIDLFNMASEPATEPAVEEEPKAEIPVNSVFGNLSDSFLDDYQEEPKLGRGETKKTSLSQLYDQSGIIVNSNTEAEVRAPQMPEAPLDEVGKWRRILDDINLTNANLCHTLSMADFRILGDSGYIVFEDSYKSLVQNLLANEEFKKVSVRIKEDFDGILHVYTCTEKQYRNVESKMGGDSKKNMADLKKKAEQMGIATELHFGDD